LHRPRNFQKCFGLRGFGARARVAGVVEDFVPLAAVRTDEVTHVLHLPSPIKNKKPFRR
jgi:hypothetical protein